ncbi:MULTISPECIES: helix-turn-helix domain-containing protein [unclassified Novosphingobium]|uniref:helix-turn-helix domain-containing protein n=1 Tax=unclassified Novosphingobium TaxID=2644732 RepID=UPI00106605DD|nr:helix-turn-helix domain-containing protein [Novosphingobium sp. PhB55]TDW65322.1 regulatory Fis family protein [Novosphingobium sp. PhB55]
MPYSEHDPTRLMLVGDLGNAMGLAVEMVRGSPASIAVGTASSTVLEDWQRAKDDLVVVDIAVNLQDVLSRLRGERANQPVAMAVSELVGQNIADVERELILKTLEHCRGNRTSAASMLGISVRTMRNKLRTFLSDGVAVPPGLIRH